MLFKASIVIMNSYLWCCSLLIQVHFKAQFFCLIMQVVHMYIVTWFTCQGIFEYSFDLVALWDMPKNI